MYPSPKFKQNKGSKSSLTIFSEGGTQNLELKFIICKDRYWRWPSMDGMYYRTSSRFAIFKTIKIQQLENISGGNTKFDIFTTF